jgi:cysteine sulfinate desulfinase/cysteine desulfurase-like protein
MGLDDDELYGAVRVSFGVFHTIDDIEKAVIYIIDAVKRIRELMA